MAIIVEDGSGVSNANSYIDSQYVVDYANARGYDVPTDIDAMLIRAMDYLRKFDWQGTRTYPNQALDWPRTGVILHGQPFPENEIPSALKDAQAQLALIAAKQDLLPDGDPRGMVISESEGDLSHKFANPADLENSGWLPFPKIDALLEDLIVGAGGYSGIGFRLIT